MDEGNKYKGREKKGWGEGRRGQEREEGVGRGKEGWCEGSRGVEREEGRGKKGWEEGRRRGKMKGGQ